MDTMPTLIDLNERGRISQRVQHLMHEHRDTVKEDADAFEQDLWDDEGNVDEEVWEDAVDTALDHMLDAGAILLPIARARAHELADLEQYQAAADLTEKVLHGHARLLALLTTEKVKAELYNDDLPNHDPDQNGMEVR